MAGKYLDPIRNGSAVWGRNADPLISAETGISAQRLAAPFDDREATPIPFAVYKPGSVLKDWERRVNPEATPIPFALYLHYTSAAPALGHAPRLDCGMNADC
jgi:hypothetical protein